MCYHTYLIPNDVELLDANAFAYETDLAISVKLEKEDTMQSQVEVVDPQNNSKSHKVHFIAILNDNYPATCGNSLDE